MFTDFQILMFCITAIVCVLILGFCWLVFHGMKYIDFDKKRRRRK